MNANEFTNKVKALEIKNGTKFEVYKGDTFITTVGIIDTKIIYLDTKPVPADMLTSDDYFFNEIVE